MKTIKTAYYGSRISDHITLDAEGYLICHNVPIARLGSQDYLAQEIGLDDQYGQVVEVIRAENEVFSPAAIASFEGKPFTNEHPPENVTPDNVNHYLKGSVRDVRRGTGEDEDLLLADIMVYDRSTIEAIQNGKREVSCGYNCLYKEMGSKQYKQTAIRGNHVALVQKGRAGERVAIKDAKPKQGRDKPMSKNGIWGKIVQATAKDATPEEMEQVVDEMTKACGSEADPQGQVKDELDPMEARMDKMESLMTQMMQMIQSQAAPTPKEPDALDALENELKGQEPSVMDEEEVRVIEAEEGKGTIDTAMFLKQVATMKPVVAKITDPQERKRTSDTLAAMIRQNMKLPQSTIGNYGQIQKAIRDNAILGNAKDTAAEDLRDLGKQWAKKSNPHYQKEAK